MNKKWDYEIPSVEIWKECLRVLKPGGHMLVACGTRTQHRMVCNIEDAGFEVRDVISWVYGQGFPKSLDINKQIDKNEYKNYVCKCKKKSEYDMRSLSETDLSQTFDIENKQGEILQQKLQEQSLYGSMQGKERKEGTENGKESCLEGWCDNETTKGKLQKCNICKGDWLDNSNVKEGRVCNGTQITNGENVQSSIGKNGSNSPQGSQSKEQSKGKSGTLAHKQGPQISGIWEVCDRCNKPIISSGIGTGLKPAQEFWTLVRKPISEKTIVDNVLRWGTGGINIDKCRIPFQSESDKEYNKNAEKRYKKSFDKMINKELIVDEKSYTIGRFPSNFIQDGSEEVMEIFDKVGISKSSKSIWNGFSSDNSNEGWKRKSHIKKIEGGYNDSGNPSRFFYCAKVSTKERNMGLDSFEDKEGGQKFSDGHTNKTMLKTGSGNDRNILSKNNHPTIKPVKLMSYLCNLITPTNGVILDPFMGSGSTGISALLNNYRFIGIELDPDYLKIAEQRINSFELYRKFLKDK